MSHNILMKPHLIRPVFFMVILQALISNQTTNPVPGLYFSDYGCVYQALRLFLAVRLKSQKPSDLRHWPYFFIGSGQSKTIFGFFPA
jgi:hypothetical protein